MTGQELRTRRLALGLTQAELANRLGVTVTTVTYWETGRRNMPRTAELLLERIEEEIITSSS